MSAVQTASMLEENRYPAIDNMIANGLLTHADSDNLPELLNHAGLTVLFFSGGARRRRESHDVAVALRELLGDYPGLVQGLLIDEGSAPALKERFRVVVEPSLVFVLNAEILEVLPGIRDWADYTAAFVRYLGAPAARETSA